MPRIALVWLLVALTVLKHSFDITWRQYTQALQQPGVTVVLQEFGTTEPLAKSTLHKALGQALIGQLERTLIELGWKTPKSQNSLTTDRTGIEVKADNT